MILDLQSLVSKYLDRALSNGAKITVVDIKVKGNFQLLLSKAHSKIDTAIILTSRKQEYGNIGGTMVYGVSSMECLFFELALIRI